MLNRITTLAILVYTTGNLYLRLGQLEIAEQHYNESKENYLLLGESQDGYTARAEAKISRDLCT